MTDNSSNMPNKPTSRRKVEKITKTEGKTSEHLNSKNNDYFHKIKILMQLKDYAVVDKF